MQQSKFGLPVTATGSTRNIHTVYTVYIQMWTVQHPHQMQTIDKHIKEYPPITPRRRKHQSHQEEENTNHTKEYQPITPRRRKHQSQKEENTNHTKENPPITPRRSTHQSHQEGVPTNHTKENPPITQRRRTHQPHQTVCLLLPSGRTNCTKKSFFPGWLQSVTACVIDLSGDFQVQQITRLPSPIFLLHTPLASILSLLPTNPIHPSMTHFWRFLKYFRFGY